MCLETMSGQPMTAGAKQTSGVRALFSVSYMFEFLFKQTSSILLNPSFFSVFGSPYMTLV